MAKIKVSSVTKGEPPCPQPAPKPAPMKRPAPTDPKHGAPPPPPFFAPGPCCPAQQQVVDNITVKSLDENKIEVIEGSYLGMKAYGIDAKTFSGIGTTGMVPPPKKGDEKKVLQADGTWVDNPEQEQADWRQNDRNAVDYIKNKPGAFRGIGTSGFVPKPVAGDEGKVLASDGSWAEIIIPEQEQADWKQTNRDAVDFIKNKPGAFKGIGTSGFVPKPVVGDEGKVLASDGSWAEILIPEQEQADWKQTDRTAVDYIKNKPNLNVYATKTELNTKVDKVDGKGLSTNDYTNAEKSKLAGIQSGAEKNVQSDWNQSNTNADDYIKNKPTIPSVDQTYNPNSRNAQSGTAVASAVSGKVDKVEGKQLSTEDYTTDEKTKLGGIEAGAQVNVQPDWNQTDESADDFIKNKPDSLNVDQVFDPTSPHAQSGTAVTGAISGKQDTITDLETIRSGAAAGASALQPSALEGYATEQYVDTGLNTKQDTISDLNTIRSGAAAGATALQPSALNGYATEQYVDDGLNTKQDTINDLDTIRSGSAAGATAVQPSDLATVATTGSYTDLSDQPDLDVYATKTEVATGLADKVNKETGKGLSTNDYTTAEQTKLAGIEAGAQVNVKPNWNANLGDDNEILNKPTLADVATTGDYDDLLNKPYIPPGVVVDQTYDPTSANAQSGTAVNEALETLDSEVTSSDGTNVAVKVTEVDGKITAVSITTDNTVGKTVPQTAGNIATLDANGDLADSGVSVSSLENRVETVSVNGGTVVQPDANKNVDLTVSELPASQGSNYMLIGDGDGQGGWTQVQWVSQSFT